MTEQDRLGVVVGGAGALALAGAFLLDPIPQAPGYHLFADRDRLLGIENFWNVATNLPFLAVGIAGLGRVTRLSAPVLRLHYIVVCVAVTFAGIGSAYYHVAPSTPALVWDRLPMAVAFMGLFSAVLADRVSPKLGRASIGPLVALGVASIGYWIHTESMGQGDLRPYAVVQFLPLLVIPLILLLSRGAGLGSASLWASLGAYATAKLAEHFDAAVLAATGMLSGHSLKHLLAALGAWAALRAFRR